MGGERRPDRGSGRPVSSVTVTLSRRAMKDKQDESAAGQIQLLSDLHSRLQSLHHTPPILLRPPAPSGLVPAAPTLHSQFQHLTEIAQILRSHPVQQALRSARDSYANDTSDLAPNPRREDRKRRHVCFLLTVTSFR